MLNRSFKNNLHYMWAGAGVVAFAAILFNIVILAALAYLQGGIKFSGLVSLPW